MESLTALLHEDARQSMPPFEMWLQGRDDVLHFWFTQGSACRGSRLIPVVANGLPAFGQYKPSGPNGELEPWALQVLNISNGRVGEFTFFLDTQRIFPLFGLPLTFPADR
jgi:RNA polymerase sigma-70 factor (ECF subfamily)